MTQVLTRMMTMMSRQEVEEEEEMSEMEMDNVFHRKCTQKGSEHSCRLQTFPFLVSNLSFSQKDCDLFSLP